MDEQHPPSETPEYPTVGAPAQLSGTSAAFSTWRPLRLPMFRNILIAGFVSDIGAFMQGVGAAWLMASQGAGPLLVALTQTAAALPFFLLALPAGAVGDIFDRRKVILTMEMWMCSMAAALAVPPVPIGLLRDCCSLWPLPFSIPMRLNVASLAIRPGTRTRKKI